MTESERGARESQWKREGEWDANGDGKWEGKGKGVGEEERVGGNLGFSLFFYEKGKIWNWGGGKEGP